MANRQNRSRVFDCRQLANRGLPSWGLGPPAHARTHSHAPFGSLHPLGRSSGHLPFSRNRCISVWAQSSAKNVLLLSSGRFSAPLSVEVDEAVCTTCQRSPAMKPALYVETLDVVRSGPGRYGPLLSRICAKNPRTADGAEGDEH